MITFLGENLNVLISTLTLTETTITGHFKSYKKIENILVGICLSRQNYFDRLLTKCLNLLTDSSGAIKAF